MLMNATACCRNVEVLFKIVSPRFIKRSMALKNVSPIERLQTVNTSYEKTERFLERFTEKIFAMWAIHMHLDSMHARSSNLCFIQAFTFLTADGSLPRHPPRKIRANNIVLRYQ